MTRQAPGVALVAELKAVSAAAKSLHVAVRSHNYLPSAFPLALLDLECEALSKLDLGSVQTAQIVMEHAVVRISDVRRNFFQIKSTEASDEDHEAIGRDEPTLERGDSLDREIVFLISSLSTALDAIRAQFQLEYASSISDEYLEALRGGDIGANAGSVMSNAVELDALATAAKDATYQPSDTVQELRRSATDARSAILATAAETSSDVVISGWLRKLARHSASTLMLLRLSIKGVRAGGGIAYDFYKRFQNAIGRIEDVVIEESSSWLADIESRLTRAEEKFRRSADAGETHYGITRYLDGRLIVLDADRTPYSIDKEGAIKPLGNAVISFRKEERAGILIATHIRNIRNVVYVQGEFVGEREAGTKLASVATAVLRKEGKAVSSRRLEQLMENQSIIPVFFWRVLGFDTFDDWVISIPGVYLYGDPGVRKNRFYSAERILLSRPPYSLFIEWAKQLVENNGGHMKLGDLAKAAGETFLETKGVPMRAIYKKPSFGDLFSADDGFLVERDTISVFVPNSVPVTSQYTAPKTDEPPATD